MCKRFEARRVPFRHCRHLRNTAPHESHDTPRRRADDLGHRPPDDARITATPEGGRGQTRPRAAARPRRPRPSRGSGRAPETSQTPVSDPSSRGRRACGTWSLSRIGRVSSSGCGSPTAAHALTAGGRRRCRRAASRRGRRTCSPERSPWIAGNSPVSALRCRPGSAAIAARCRPAAAAAAAAASLERCRLLAHLGCPATAAGPRRGGAAATTRLGGLRGATPAARAGRCGRRHRFGASAPGADRRTRTGRDDGQVTDRRACSPSRRSRPGPDAPDGPRTTPAAASGW